nr:ribonuclease H-like domain-containing protein [Tanacetum cinerariifolium]
MKVQVLKVWFDNGTKFKNEKPWSYYENLGIMHQTSIARTPQQKGVVECKNQTLVEAASTMLISSTIPKFLWAEAIDATWFTQSRSLVHTRTPKVIDNFAANTLDNEYTLSSSSIIVEDHDTPQLLSSLEEPIANKPTTPVFDNHSDEQVQKDVAEHDANTFMNAFGTLEFKEAESSSNYQDPSNMHKFHQQHRFTDRWTKNHPIEQVIGDPSKPVTTRSRLHTNAKMCMYALKV